MQSYYNGSRQRTENRNKQKTGIKNDTNINNNSEIKAIEDYFKEKILDISNLKSEYDEYIKKAKVYAEYLKKNGLTTSQIRRVYSEIMLANDVITLKRLRPRLAYIQGRNQKNKAINSLLEIVDLGLANLQISEDDSEENIEIKSLKEFMETIVAYLKYFGDKY